MKIFIHGVFIAIFTLLLSGCFSKSVKPTTYYPLSVAHEKIDFTCSAKDGVVKVLQPVSKHSLNSNSIVYLQNGEQNEYTQSKFSDPLSKIMQYYLVDTLENCMKFRGVIFSTSNAKYDYTLESNILKFEHNIAKKSVDVEIKLILINSSKDIVAMKKFQITKSVYENNAKSAVGAFEASLNDLQKEIREWLISI